jgi:hypothetical protein
VATGQSGLSVQNCSDKQCRQHKVTMTIKNNANTLIAIVQTYADDIRHPSLFEDPAYRPGMIIQPIAGAQLGNSTSNSLGLDCEDHPLWCEFAVVSGHIWRSQNPVLSFEVRWSDRSKDDPYFALVDGLLLQSQRIAGMHGTQHPFIYLNYAAAYQDPFELLRARGGLADLAAVRDEFDAEGYLQRHLKQPFKIDS